MSFVESDDLALSGIEETELGCCEEGFTVEEPSGWAGFKRSGMALEDSVPNTCLRYLSKVPEESDGVSSENVNCSGFLEEIEPPELSLPERFTGVLFATETIDGT